MNIKEAKQLKANLEEEIFNSLKNFEQETELEVALILIERIDISQMGGEKKSQLNGLEIVVGVDVPATPKGGGGQ